MSESHKNTAAKKKPVPVSTKVGIAVIAVIAIYMGTMIWGGGLLENGTAAPTWSMVVADGSGDKLDLADLKGKVVLVDFWSTTCPPCLKEMKILDELYGKYDRKDLEIVGVASGGESLEEITSFAKRKGIPYPLVVDKTGTVADLYLVRSLPTIYLLGREGKILDSHTGLWSKTDLAGAINDAIGTQ